MSRRHILGRIKITGAALSIALLIPLLFRTDEAFSTAGAPTMDDVRAEAVRGGYRLIDLGELRGRLEREPGGILLVDTRQDWEYRTGHIPGAINFSFAQFTAVKVDLTSSGTPLNERLLREYVIKGVPTIVFLGADGRERPGLRLVDYLPAEGFLTHMRAAQVKQ